MKNANDKLRKVLFVDDDKSIINSLRRFSRNQKWEAITAHSGKEALKILQIDKEIDVVVSDMRMPEMTGDELLAKVKQEYPDIVRIILTGYSDISSLGNAINNAKIFNYVTKPWDNTLLTDIIEGALDYAHEKREKIGLIEITRKQNRQLAQLALGLEKQVKERTIEIEQALTLLKMTNNKLNESLDDTLTILTHIIERSEAIPSSHSQFIAECCDRIAAELELNDDAKSNLKLASSLYRLGLLILPPEVRNTPRYELSQEQMDLYDQYPNYSKTILQFSKQLAGPANIIASLEARSIEKKWLTNKSTPMETQILNLVHEYNELSRGRVHPSISGSNAAIEHLQSLKNIVFSEQLIDYLVKVLNEEALSEKYSVDIKLSDLAPGMQIKSDILTMNGLLLLTKGTLLTETNIVRLKAYKKQLDFDQVVKVESFDDMPEGLLAKESNGKELRVH